MIVPTRAMFFWWTKGDASFIEPAPPSYSRFKTEICCSVTVMVRNTSHPVPFHRIPPWFRVFLSTASWNVMDCFLVNPDELTKDVFVITIHACYG